MESALQKNHNVTGLTISNAQASFAKQRLQHKLNEKSQIKIQDYRDEKNKYDAIVSIEMFEAVGEKFWPNYFDKVHQCLENQGLAMIQTITIRDDLFDQYRKRSDYIRAYTFPGGMLPSLEKFKMQANRANLDCKDVFSFGKDYAKTLKEWLKNFKKVEKTILDFGYKQEFIRSWEFYLALCIGGFESGQTNVSQILLQKN